MWTDRSESAYRVAPRVNASLEAVPPPGPDAADTRAPPGGRLFLFGGDDGTNPLGDLWVYDVAANRWEEPEQLKACGDLGDPKGAHWKFVGQLRLFFPIICEELEINDFQLN